jgi:hypothetical protein
MNQSRLGPLSIGGSPRELQLMQVCLAAALGYVQVNIQAGRVCSGHMITRDGGHNTLISVPFGGVLHSKLGCNTPPAGRKDRRVNHETMGTTSTSPPRCCLPACLHACLPACGSLQRVRHYEYAVNAGWQRAAASLMR